MPPLIGRQSSPSSSCTRRWRAAPRGDFLRRLIAAVPYKVHTVLTDNGTHFTTPGNTSSAAPDIKAALEAGEPVWAQAQASMDQWASRKNVPHHQGRDCQTLLLRDPRPDANSPVRLRRRLQLRQTPQTLRGLTPYEFICKPRLQTHTDSKSARSRKCRDETSRPSGAERAPITLLLRSVDPTPQRAMR